MRMSPPSPAGEPSPAAHCTEGAERENERLFLHAMLDSSPDLIYFKDSKSRFLRINRALATYFGLNDPAEALGKTDFDFHPPEKARGMFQDECRIMETKTPMVDKIERETPVGGKLFWMLTSKAPLCDEQGRVVGTFGISRDITLLKDTEDALWLERNLLRSVIDNVPDFIFAKDTAARYILSNLAHTHFLLRNSPEELLGKSALDVFPPEIAASYHRDDLAVLESHAPILNKVELSQRPNGGESWLSITKVPLFNYRGAVTGVVSVARDITLQKQAQEALEQTNLELRGSREDLMRTLGELRALQLELVEAEKMKLVGRLAAGVAHEVKNPLAIIEMGLEYLTRQSFDDPNITVILQEIGHAVTRADSVVRELLDFSAPKKMNMAPADVNRLLHHALVLVRGEFNAFKIAVHEELAPDLPLVRLDAMKIEQVFVNVFSNAAQAMEQGGGHLTVKTSTRQVMGVGDNFSHSDGFPLGARLVTIQVLDTGPGVPEGMSAKVFEPFFTTKPTGKGSGLGLTVTKTIIDLHGGTIEIANRPEGGACVTIVLNANAD